MTDDELKRDKAICEAATKGRWRWWTSNSHRRLKSDAGGHVAYGTRQRDDTDDIVISDEDMRAIENAVNRLPLYIAEAQEMARRIEEMAKRADMLAGANDPTGALQIHAAGMREALRILRGEK